MFSLPIMIAAVFRFDPRVRAFCWLRGLGAPIEAFGDELPNAMYRMGEERGLVGLVGARAKPLHIADLADDPRWVASDLPVRSCYMTPIMIHDRALGVLALFAASGFSETCRALADLFASELSQTWTLSMDAQQGCDRGTGAEFPGSCSLASALSKILEGQADNSRFARGDSLPPPELRRLSTRELEVVQALRQGLRLSEVARVLSISHHTARNHLKHVFKKLGVHSQVELLSLMGGSRGT